MSEKVAALEAQSRLSDSPPGSATDSSAAPVPPAASTAFGHKIDGDEALRAIDQDAAPIEIDAATNKRLLRKIDMWIMPFLCLVYGLQFLDKTTLSYASITGMPQEIHLVGDNYQWLSSIFYIGYLGYEFLAIRLLQYFPLAKYSGVCIVLWGLIVACFSGVHNFAGAVAIRVLLGMMEASVSPGWALFTSQWYRKEEQGIRTAWWVSFNGWAQIFGGLVAYGFAHGASTHSYDITIAPWKAIYIFTGSLTVVVGALFLFLMPDNQLNARWLSPEDRVLAVERVRVNQQGIGNRHFKVYQLKETLLDPAVWAIALLAFAGQIPNGGLTNFFSMLLESFGLTAQQSLLYGTISGVIEVFAILTWGYTARYLDRRLLVGSVGLVLSLVGSVLLVALPLSNPRGRLAGFFLAQFFTTGIVCVASIVSTNVAGYTKKTIVAGTFFIFYAVGNIIGPQTFRPQDAPNYRPAEITLIVCYGIALLDLFFLHWWYKNQNKKKEAICSQPGYRKVKNSEFLDLTDRENPEFRYVL